MDDPRSPADKLAGLEGADAAALGTVPPPQTAPEAAQVDPEEVLVPGADFGDRVATDSKPWFTSLADESRQAGVGNDPPQAQETDYPYDDEEHV